MGGCGLPDGDRRLGSLLVQRRADRADQRVRIERLLQEPQIATRESSARALTVDVPGDEDDAVLHLRPALTDVVVERRAVHAGHADVRHHQVVLHGLQSAERLLAAGRGRDEDACVPEDLGRQCANRRFVIDDQDALGGALRLRVERRGGRVFGRSARLHGFRGQLHDEVRPA